MRYSKVLLVFSLSLLLIIGSMYSSFATNDLLQPSRITVPTLDAMFNPVEGSVSPVTYGWEGIKFYGYVTATANPGYVFDKWEIQDLMNPSSWTVQSTSPGTKVQLVLFNRTIRACFKELFTLSISVNDTDMGGFTGTLPGDYIEGTDINIVPILAKGHHLSSWTKQIGDAAPVMMDGDDPLIMDMPAADMQIVLNFSENPSYLVSGIVTPPGSGIVEYTGFYPHGIDVTLHAKPERGHSFNEWIYDSDDISPILDGNEITFEMPEKDVNVTAEFYELEKSGVRFVTVPDGKGNPTLDEFAIPGGPDDEFDFYYYSGEYFNVNPNPILHWHFVGYDWKCIGYDEASLKSGILGPSQFMSTDPNYDFSKHSCDTEITVYYEEDDYVTATIRYLNASDVSIKDDTQEKVYNGAYTLAPPAISGYTFGVSSANASGTITNESENFTVIHKYYVPQVITNTNTVTETVFVNVPVPATTEAPTVAITEEVVPLGEAIIVNFDEIFADEEPIVTEAPVVVEEEETPLADALPQTGQLPVELFYGIGGLVSTIGLYIRRKR